MFKTKKQAEIAVSDFQSLTEHPGWKLVVEILDKNIELLRKRVEEKHREMEKEELDACFDKISIYEEVKNTPQTMVERLQSQEGEEERLDPFDTLEDIKYSHTKTA